MTKKFTVVLLVVTALLVISTQGFCATINVHWTPNLNDGGVAHGTTVSGNIWINFIQPMDSDPNTIQNMTFVEGYIQENAHNAPQVALSMPNTNTCASCSGSNQMVISTDPSVIMQLSHNATYTIYIKARVSGMRMFPLGALTPYDVSETIIVTGDNLAFTDSPDNIIAWDPDTMSSINLSSSYSDAQTGKCSLIYNIYSTIRGLVYTQQFTNLDRPGNHSWSWNGRNTLNEIIPKGLYIVKATVIADMPTMTSDCNKSGYLQVLKATDEQGNPLYTVDFIDVDENGTPDDETDDNVIYGLSYKLQDTGGLDASGGEIWLYSPDNELLMSRDISSLYCVNHSAYDGLDASSRGIQHCLHIAIPAYLLESSPNGGVCSFVVHAVDSHANDYKQHTNKPAIVK